MREWREFIQFVMSHGWCVSLLPRHTLPQFRGLLLTRQEDVVIRGWLVSRVETLEATIGKNGQPQLGIPSVPQYFFLNPVKRTRR